MGVKLGLIAKEDRVTRGRVDKLDELTSEQVNCEERQSNKGTSGQEDELTSEQVDCEGSQNNRGTGVKTYDIWGEKGLKKARD